MLSIVVVFVSLALVGSAMGKAKFLTYEGDVVENSYMIRLKSGASFDALTQLEHAFMGVSSQQIQTKKVSIGDDYKLLIVRNCSKRFLNIAMDNEAVEYVEQDGLAHALDVEQTCAVQTTNVPWGISRITHDSPAHDNEFKHSQAWGSSVKGYILDTGVRITHVDFGGRAVYGANFVTPGADPTDRNGHGTHVASTMGGNEYGVSRSSTLVAVKVLSDGGSGSWSGIIEGIEFVTSEHQKGSGASVSNMSLGGGKQVSVDAAVDASVEAGVVHILAAGNSNNNACTLSPAGSEKGITVVASDIAAFPPSDTRSSFSSYGPCTQIIAPGSDILGAWSTSDTATRTISGTSMASPHVAGVAMAVLTQQPNLTPAQLLAALEGKAEKNVVSLNCANAICSQTPNVLLSVEC